MLEHSFVVDGSCDYTTGVVAVGMVVHATVRSGRKGPIVGRIGEAFSGVPYGLAEHLAILRALEVAAERGYRHVRVYSDCTSLRRVLNEAQRDFAGLERQDVIGQILRLARTFGAVQFRFMRRPKALMAHRLARSARVETTPKQRPDLAPLWPEPTQPRRGPGVRAAEGPLKRG